MEISGGDRHGHVEQTRYSERRQSLEWTLLDDYRVERETYIAVLHGVSGTQQVVGILVKSS